MQSVEPCEFLPWDTAFFGRRIARVVGHRLNPQRVCAILEWCRVREIEYLYFLAAVDDQQTVRLAEDHGFRLVDIRVTLQCSIGDRRSGRSDETAQAVRVRPARAGDIPLLQEIARTSYGDSRFYFDPCFSVEACENLYATWIKRSCEGYADAVLVAEAEGRPIGYVSCHLLSNKRHGQIGLVGVGPQARNRGVGHLLICHSLQWFAERGVDEVSVVTQGRSIAAQRLYQRCGFATHSVQLWYHKSMGAGRAKVRS